MFVIKTQSSGRARYYKAFDGKTGRAITAGKIDAAKFDEPMAKVVADHLKQKDDRGWEVVNESASA